MTVDNMKKITFKKSDFEQWKELAVASLKGKPYENLKTATLEDIEIQPLYFEKSSLNSSSIVSSMKRKAGWIIAQQTIATNGDEFLDAIGRID